jgi:hypothetical protein
MPGEYRSYAAECLRWAADAGDEEDRQAFLEMAKMWTQLALHEAGPESRSGPSAAAEYRAPDREA